MIEYFVQTSYLNGLPAVIASLGNLCLIIGDVLEFSPLDVVVVVEVLTEFSFIRSFILSVTRLGVSVDISSGIVVTSYESPIPTDS